MVAAVTRVLEVKVAHAPEDHFMGRRFNSVRRLGLKQTLVTAASLLALWFMPTLVNAQPGKDKDKDGPPKTKDGPKLGLAINDPKAFQGYTLVTTLNSKKTYLIDMQGKVVQTWDCDCPPALTAFLLENGNLFRPGGLSGAWPPRGTCAASGPCTAVAA